MPLYEYACRGCGSLVELLVRDQETPACTACGSEKLQRQLSVIAAHVGRGQSDFQPCEAPSPGSIPGGCGLPQCGTGGCQFG